MKHIRGINDGLKSKINFLYFISLSNIKTYSIKTNLGFINMFLEDVDSEMTIVNGDIKFTILDQHYYTIEEIQDIELDLKHINWDNGYEFFDFYDTQTGETYQLIGDRNSNTFNQINSTQNKKNINNFRNSMDNWE